MWWVQARRRVFHVTRLLMRHRHWELATSSPARLHSPARCSSTTTSIAAYTPSAHMRRFQRSSSITRSSLQAFLFHRVRRSLSKCTRRPNRQCLWNVIFKSEILARRPIRISTSEILEHIVIDCASHSSLPPTCRGFLSSPYTMD